MDEFRNFDAVWSRVTERKENKSKGEERHIPEKDEEKKTETRQRSYAVRFIPNY